MEKLYRPEIGELEALRSAATEGGSVSEAEWADRCCKASARLLRRDPRRYRSYGPYWWALKKAMIDRGVDDFGEFVDAEWLGLCSYPTEFYTLLAAWVYGDGRFDMGALYSNEHNMVFINEDGDSESRVYIAADDEMELLALESKR